MSDREDIIRIIETFFECGKTKDLTPLREIQLNDSAFSSFSDVPPYDLKDYKTTVDLEELRFVSISDYDYKIRIPKIRLFGDVAIVAFELIQKGMLVAVRDAQEYTWQALRSGYRPGMGQHIPDRLFWAREDDQGQNDE